MPKKVPVERDEVVIHYDHKNPILAELMDEFFLKLIHSGVAVTSSWSKPHTAHLFGQAPVTRGNAG